MIEKKSLLQRRFVALAIVGALVGSVLAGCSGSQSGAEGADGVIVSPEPAMNMGLVVVKPLADGASVPTFSGPFSSEFQQAYLSSQSDLQREVLADGQISDQEMSALRDAFAACAEQRGLSEVVFGTDGSMSLTAGEGMDESAVNGVVTECGTPTIDGVDVIYNTMQRNPNNEDIATIMAECLIAVGLAPGGYSRQDYLRESPDDSFAFDSDSLAFRSCVQDPLAAMKNK